MNNIDWSTFKVRCSAINDVLSESKPNPSLTESQEKILARYRKSLDAGKALTRTQEEEMKYFEAKEENSKKLILSDTCIKYLMTEYSWITEGMIPVGKEQLNLVAIKKGNMCESDGIALLIELDGLPYKIHKERIYSDYLSGQIDAYLGEGIMNATKIVDNKCSWDYPIYLSKLHSKVDPGHDKQVKGYMSITGAKKGDVVHTLVDCPPGLIEDALWALTRKLNATTPESPEVLELWPTWAKSMVFSHMPVHKRVHKIKIDPFTELEQRRLHDKVKICRDWLNNFHEGYQKKNL
jgi:hypothetical protein